MERGVHNHANIYLGTYSCFLQEFAEPVQTIVYYQEKDQLVITTGGCNLHLLGKDDAAGTWHTISKMKFATGTGETATQLQVSFQPLG